MSMSQGRYGLFLFALVVTASTLAFGQSMGICEACTHEVSYFKGKGGLIAKADGATEVAWITECGGIFRSGKLTANADGMVATLFDDDNNLACSFDDGWFRLGPVTDGGWFWITDDENSAVGNLIAMEVLEAVRVGSMDTVALVDAGPGVTMAPGRGAVFIKEMATGRVGILPNILPSTGADDRDDLDSDCTDRGFGFSQAQFFSSVFRTPGGPLFSAIEYTKRAFAGYVRSGYSRCLLHEVGTESQPISCRWAHSASLLDSQFQRRIKRSRADRVVKTAWLPWGESHLVHPGPPNDATHPFNYMYCFVTDSGVARN